MITFITGVPGSGKSYKAVNSIYNNFSDDKNAKKDLKKEYENCYTNINEFQFDKVDNVFTLDIDDLKDKLAQLHDLYKQKVTDEVLIEKCKEFKIYKSLFVIDEAHNIFDVNNVVLIWWLSYHRHLYHDIFLITQNLSLVFSKYKAFSEFFYKAKPTTVSVNGKTFKYDVYINSRMSMNAKSHTEKLKKNDAVFKLYHSGDSVGAKNVLLKFYLFSFFMLFVFFGLIYYLFFTSDTTEKETTQKTTQKFMETSIPSTTVKNVPQSLNYSELQYLNLKCNYNDCFNNDITIPFPVFQHFLKIKDISIIYQSFDNPETNSINCYMSKDLYNFLKGGQDEKDTDSIDIPSIMG